MKNNCDTCRFFANNDTNKSVKEWFTNDGKTKITVIVEQYEDGMCVYNGLKTAVMEDGNWCCSAYILRRD